MPGTRTIDVMTPPLYHDIMARIPLSGKNGTGKYATVDEEDVEKVAGIRWYLSDTGYAMNRHANNGKHLRMHRLINNTPANMYTDHKNGNKLDNRKANLRTVTLKQNAQNRKGVKGYTWDESKRKWMVRHRYNYYGRYETEAEARRAYQLAQSGVPYEKSRRKYWHLPKNISKQFGRYRVRVQKDGERVWLGAYATLDQAKAALKEWQERGY